jgi:hypothetical protein
VVPPRRCGLSRSLSTASSSPGRNEQVDLLVCDETHTLSNLNTYKASEVAMLPKRHSLLLTGTPAANDLMGLYLLLELAAPGALSARSFGMNLSSHRSRPAGRRVRRGAHVRGAGG